MSNPRTFGLALLFGLASACGSSDQAPPRASDDLPISDAGRRDSGGKIRADSALDLDARPMGDAMSPSLGELLILDVPNTPCIPSQAPAVPLSEGAATASGFEKMGQLGDRRFAFGAEGSVVITFGFDGASPSPPLLGALAVAAQNGGLETLVAQGDGLGLQFYDAQGMAQGSPVALAGSMAAGPSLGAGPTTSLAVWCTPDGVKGQLVDQGRAPGPAVSFQSGSAGESACRTVTLWNGANFTVVWTRLLHDTKTETSIAYVDLDGTIAFGKVLLLSSGAHQLVDLVRAPFGYVLLLNEGERSGNPIALELDDFGKIAPPAVRLQGSGAGFSVATFGSSFAIAALLTDGRAAMRPFDSAARVLGPWVCVDDRPPDMPLAGKAALGTDDQGYAVAARMSDGSNWYMRTNSLGDRSPTGD
jgi:hypothetical protein